ncbi:MAG: DUF4153 domain-containing protein [Pelagimonas sp.]|uniref:DUF4153 domain-containing protein n=1 Tax=Pelagimonas sp. TaxID=2073170 RepID=UPI003D6BE2D4
MTNRLKLRGIPRVLKQDAWWLCSNHDLPPSPQEQSSRENPPLALGILLLFLTADLLFWDVEPGVSLALFSIATLLIATNDITPRKRIAGPLLLVMAGSLPIIEFVQILSSVFLVASFCVALVWARADVKSLEDIAQGLWALPGHYLDRLIRPVASLCFSLPKQSGPKGFFARVMRQWGFPIGGALVFGALILMANPVLLQAFSFRLPDDLIARLAFGLGLTFLCTPFLFPVDARKSFPAIEMQSDTLTFGNIGLNPDSCLRALWVFNALIGLQTLVDMSIFIGGAELPTGMTYASYAHRGSYPLVATALLAGGFALAARPLLNEHRALKPLMYLWLAQNVIMCLSAALRLDLYVGAYGLTYLRLYAVIWIGLVATGLVLIALQTRFEKSNFWLTGVWLSALTVVLYLCCFVNFAEHIVRQNLTMTDPDFDYICTLNPTARGALGHPAANGLKPSCPINQLNTLDNWQEWGFRNWRSGLYDNSRLVMAETDK